MMVKISQSIQGTHNVKFKKTTHKNNLSKNEESENKSSGQVTKEQDEVFDDAELNFDWWPIYRSR